MCLWINFSANVATAPAKENQINVGTVFKDCPMCPEMSVIPSGTFLMGSIKGRKRERPVTKITIPRPLAVGRYEVTFDQWDACFTDGGCSKKPSDRGWGRGSRPIINILLTDIAEYVSWLSRKTGHLYRLPSESEWEYAARAGSQTEFYWGDQMRPGAANCRGCGTQWSGHQSSPVGQFKPNAWGLYDMHGNVLEYVTDCWSKSHDKIPIDGSPKLTDNCLNKVVKGGSWYYLSRVSRSASRARNDKRVFSYFIGFRVFRELKLVKNDETDRMK
jgi:formylglycine-generating enzyme required for sulfatase activity